MRGNRARKNRLSHGKVLRRIMRGGGRRRQRKKDLKLVMKSWLKSFGLVVNEFKQLAKFESEKLGQIINNSVPNKCACRMYLTYPTGSFLVSADTQYCDGILITGGFCERPISVGERYFDTDTKDVHGRPFILCMDCAMATIGHLQSMSDI